MHAYICTYIHTYIHIHTHTHTQTYIHACIHTYIRTYIHTLIIILIKSRPKGQACQAPARNSTYVSTKRHWNNRKYGASKRRLSTRE